MEYKKYLTEDMVERVIDLYPKCFVIEYNDKVLVDNSYVGKVIFKNKVTKRTISIGKNVSFSKDKVKYKTNGNGKYRAAIVNQYWVKPFINDPRIPIKVKIYKSKIDSSGKRVYYEDDEKIELTYTQYVKRMLIYDFRNYKYQIMEAYDNFKRRYAKHGDYYLALNETCKHYFITHDMLKIVLAKIDNAKKRYKKNWKDEYILFLENNRDQKLIDEITKEYENDVNFDKVVYLGDR